MFVRHTTSAVTSEYWSYRQSLGSRQLWKAQLNHVNGEFFDNAWAVARYSDLAQIYSYTFHVLFTYSLSMCLFCDRDHRLDNKTVVRPKSTIGSTFLQEYIRYFWRRVWTITPPPRKFRFAFLCELIINCLCPFMHNISLILLHKWFRWCRYR